MIVDPFEFQSVLFNFHDLVLIMTAFQCLFFGILLFITNTERLKSIFFLVAFLFSHFLIPINELIMWGAQFRWVVQKYFMGIHFIPTFAYYVDAPLMYIYINYLVFKNFTLKKTHLLLLIPLIAYIIFIYLTFFSNSTEQRLVLIASQSFAYSEGFVTIELINKLIRVSYLVACFVLINRYKDILRDNFSTVSTTHINWLKFLVVGFLIVMFSEALLAATKVFILFEFFPPSIGQELFFRIGLTGNYMSFILVNLLVFTSVRDFAIFKKVADKSTSSKQVEERFVNPEMAEVVDLKIRETKVYMEPELTLDKLAESLEITPRDLSMLINRHFEVNFYEFINTYRIDEAKKMLISEDYENTTITDIYLAVGFNSKSVFYTFFKKFAGMTPSQFRLASNK